MYFKNHRSITLIRHLFFFVLNSTFFSISATSSDKTSNILILRHLKLVDNRNFFDRHRSFIGSVVVYSDVAHAIINVSCTVFFFVHHSQIYALQWFIRRPNRLHVSVCLLIIICSDVLLVGQHFDIGQQQCEC